MKLFSAKQVGKAGAVAALNVFLCAAAVAAPNNGNGPVGNANVDLAGRRPRPPFLPEANAGLVLIPVVAAALFFSTRRLWPAKAAVIAREDQQAGR